MCWVRHLAQGHDVVPPSKSTYQRGRGEGLCSVFSGLAGNEIQGHLGDATDSNTLECSKLRPIHSTVKQLGQEWEAHQ